jgi:epoxyqueuosine reductase QueG
VTCSAESGAPARGGALPSAYGLPREAASDLIVGGFNVAGVLSARVYDERVSSGWSTAQQLPAARSVVVLGCGGTAFEKALAQAPERGHPVHPVDGFTRRVVKTAARRMRAKGLEARALFYWERITRSPTDAGPGEFADFAALAEAAGLGAPGRLRILLHPHFGPWLAIRALLMTSAHLAPTAPAPGFAPCEHCPAPCADACPAGAIDEAGLDMETCFDARRGLTACAESCAARHACVIGPEHAYGPGADRHYMRTALAHFSASTDS